MKILDVVQGSPEWLAARAKFNCASDAPAMMGASKYMSRNELLKQKATGITPEIDPNTQRLFDRGHAAEAAIRPHIESIIGDELYPATGVEGGLLASFDGVTMTEDTIFEHKLYGAELAAQVKAGELDPHYYWQIEQQLLVSGAKRCIFVTSDGTPERCEHMIYTPVPGRARALLDGWQQFRADLADWKPAEAVPIVTAAITEALPAVSVRMDGAIAVISNLDVFGAKLAHFIENIDKAPSTDQAFADAEAACKTLSTAEDALKQAEAAALAQTSSIDDMRRTVGRYAEMARSTRLMLEKIVKARKEQIRVEIQQEAQQKFVEHVAAINKRLGKVQLPAITANFALVMKGKKTVSGVRSAVDDELARVKIEANAIGEKIDANLRSLRESAAGFEFLFSDAQQLVMKANDDLVAVIENRIGAHKAEQQRKEDEDRERIRQEELARIAREQAAARQREADEAAQLAPTVASELTPPAEAAKPASSTAGVSVAAPQAADVARVSASVSAIEPRRSPAAARPTDMQIVDAVAAEFGVTQRVAIDWLRTMNLRAMVAA